MSLTRPTLRDARRFAAKVMASGSGFMLHMMDRRSDDHHQPTFVSVHLSAEGPWVSVVFGPYSGMTAAIGKPIRRDDAAVSTLDRLIGILGPQWPNSLPDGPAVTRKAKPSSQQEQEQCADERPEGEDRPKGTDEADGGEQGGDASHGGDGNSGEVDSPSETKGSGRANGQEQQSEQPTGATGEDGSSEPSGVSEGGGGNASAAQPATAEREASPADQDELTSGMGARRSPGEPGASDTPMRIAEGEARDAAQDPGAKKAAGGGRGDASSPDDHATQVAASLELSSNYDWTDKDDSSSEANRGWASQHSGGSYLDQQMAKWLSTQDRKDAAEAGRAIQKMVRRMAVEPAGDPSPRIHAGRLARELVSRRYALSRARRDDVNKPVVLLMADVSGSCSAAATATVAACLAVAKRLNNVVTVVHSNGFVESAHGDHPLAKRLQSVPGRGDLYDKESHWETALQEECVGLTVAFGDGDAADIYELLCNRAPLVWLDSFGSQGPPRPASARSSKMLQSWKNKPTYWVGVNDTRKAAYALREIARRTPP